MQQNRPKAMNNPQLFLGIPTDAYVSGELDKISNPKLIDIFINNKDYLHRIESDNTELIGKFLPDKASINEISLLESNIQSIIQSKLIPNFDFVTTPLRVYTIT